MVSCTILIIASTDEAGTSLTMIVYSTNSDFADKLAENVNVRVDDMGIIYIGKTAPQQQQANQPQELKTGGSCYSQKQCDATKGYVCAQPLKLDLPLSSTWGRFTCVALAATVQVAKTYKECSRGRCLLESDGSVAIESDNSTISQTEYAVYANKNHANPPLINQTHQNATVVSADQSFVRSINLTVNDHGSFNPQFCPCNCTTWSFSCCFSDTVQSSNMSIGSFNITYDPPMPGLVCDTQSGEWKTGSPVLTINSTETFSSPANLSVTGDQAHEAHTPANIQLGEDSASQTVATIQLVSSATSIMPSRATSASDQGVCKSSNEVCFFNWNCGDSEHCVCGSVPNDIIGFTYFHCVPKPGSTGPSNNNNKKREEGSAYSAMICPCNCTYTSPECCNSMDGVVHEPTGNNMGPVRLPVRNCCDQSDGSIKESGLCP